MAISNEKVAYYNDTVSKHVYVRYKYTTDTALTAGKTAAEIIAKAESLISGLDLPNVDVLKVLKTRICKSGSNYAVITSLRYIAA